MLRENSRGQLNAGWPTRYGTRQQPSRQPDPDPELRSGQCCAPIPDYDSRRALRPVRGGPACTAPASLTAGRPSPLALRPARDAGLLAVFPRCLSLLQLPETRPTNGRQRPKFNPVEPAPANKAHGWRPRDSSGPALRLSPDLYGFRGSLEGVWSTGGLPTFFLHYLTASGGCWDTGGLGSRLDSVLQPPGEYL